jgi:hypothetical protein
LLDIAARLGIWALLTIALFFAAYVGVKLLQRRRLRKLYRLVRIAPHEVARLIADDASQVAILDARSRLARAEDPRTLPLAIFIDGEDAIGDLPPELREMTVITFCTCPNEASAALLAERLLRSGYDRVRVLTGGKDALAVLASD